ncbi:MAG: flagellar motor protein MotB, partial [Bacteroidota bacterium]
RENENHNIHKGNEIFPYAANNLLYFSTDGLPGLGGADLFSVSLSGTKTTGTPKNLGYPINSSSDDFGIMFDTSSKGYFSSNRLGSDDVFAFEK